MQLLFVMDHERNYSMGSPIDRTPPQFKDLTEIDSINDIVYDVTACAEC